LAKFNIVLQKDTTAVDKNEMGQTDETISTVSNTFTIICLNWGGSGLDRNFFRDFISALKLK